MEIRSRINKKLFMSHYKCAGECGGVSGAVGACKAEDCSKKCEPLESCDCGDDSHNKKENEE